MYNECLQCNEKFYFKFKSQSSRKYCSVICSDASKKNKKRPGHGEKVRKALLGRSLTKERKQKIGIANTKVLSQLQEKELKEILSRGYVSGYKAASHHLTFSISQRVFNRYKKMFKEKKELPELPQSFFSNHIQKWPLPKFETFKSDLRNLKTKKVITKYNLDPKVVRIWLAHLNLKWIPLFKGEGSKFTVKTKPEEVVERWFIEADINYTYQYLIDTKFFDYRVGSVLIEVQGDYWHCNPKIYKKPINSIQLQSRINDTIKKELAIANGFTLVYIWENDIKKKPAQTKKELIKKLCKQ